MPAQGRSRWICGNRMCGKELATIRGEHPKRRMSPSLNGIEARFFEDGTVHIRCRGCGKVNVFEWRVPMKG